MKFRTTITYLNYLCYKEIFEHLSFEDQWKVYELYHEENSDIIHSIGNLLLTEKTTLYDSDLTSIYRHRSKEEQEIIENALGSKVRSVHCLTGFELISPITLGFPNIEKLYMELANNDDIRCITSRLPYLRELELGGFWLYDDSCLMLEEHPRLQSIKMTICESSRAHEVHLSKLTKLKTLIMKTNYYGDHFSELCLNSKNLKTLDIRSAKLWGSYRYSLREALLELKNLEELWIKLSPRFSPYDYLAELPKLEKLVAENAECLEEDFFMKLKNKKPQMLKYLDLTYKRVFDVILPRVESLEYFVLKGPTINNNDFRMICSCYPNLKQLKFTFDFYDDVSKDLILDGIRSLKRLEVLEIHIFSSYTLRELMDIDHDFLEDVLKVLKEMKREKLFTLVGNEFYELWQEMNFQWRRENEEEKYIRVLRKLGTAGMK